MDDIKLPPLPEPWVDTPTGWAFDEKAMQAYARQAVLMERERCAAICEVRAADHEETAREGTHPDDWRSEVYAKHIRRCAAAIRAQ